MTKTNIPDKISVRLPPLTQKQLADIASANKGATVTQLIVQAIAALWHAIKGKAK